MLSGRKGMNRQHAVHAGLLKWITFVLGDRNDPFWNESRAVQGLNEECVGLGYGISSQSRKNARPFTFLLDGLPLHEEDLGNTGFPRSGDLHFMSAGRGICHRRFSGSHLEKTDVGS